VLEGVGYQGIIISLNQGGGVTPEGRDFRSNDLFAPLAAGANRRVKLNSAFTPPQAA